MDDLIKAYKALNADEKRVIDISIIIIFNKIKQDTVSDEAMAGYIAYVTQFVDLMKVVKAKFDAVAQHPPTKVKK